ncbi:heme oxygenase-like protein [Atractiella rhizophila]|nr:heme oxygenase-like protein [Atractiella rhizophila]
MTVAYTRYVLDVGNSQSLLALRVATYPCLLGYGEMGLWLAEEVQDDNPYLPWIRDYAGAEFQLAVKTGRDLLERSVRESPISVKELDNLVNIFGKATQLEIGFWQQAWDMT